MQAENRRGFPVVASQKEPVCQYRRHKKHGFDPWVWKIPWKRAWQPTPLFLPGESHGQRSLEGYSPWGCKESEMTSHACQANGGPLSLWGQSERGTSGHCTPWPLFQALGKSCPILCNPMDWSPPGSSVHDILQAKILEWVAMPSSRGSSKPGDQTRVSYVSCIGK